MERRNFYRHAETLVECLRHPDVRVLPTIRLGAARKAYANAQYTVAGLPSLDSLLAATEEGDRPHDLDAYSGLIIHVADVAIDGYSLCDVHSAIRARA